MVTDIDILKYVSFYQINRFLLLRDFFDGCNDDLKKLDFSSLDTIILGGEVSNHQMIEKIRTYFSNLPSNAILSIYGRTENYGYVCSCREDKIKTLYINVSNSNSNEIFYTFDKKTIYKLYINNGNRIIEKTDLKYYDILYINYISVSDSLIENVRIEENKIIGEIIVDDKPTGDLGIYLDNQLFVIGRKNDLVVINNREYNLSMIEQLFNHITDLKTAAIYNEENNKMFIAINYKLNPQIGDNFKSIIPLVKRCNRIVDVLNLPLEYPIFVSSNKFPKTKLMRKTKKGEISKLIPLNDEFQRCINNYEECFLLQIKRIFNNVFNRNINLLYQDNEVVFNKKEVSFNELIELQKDSLGYINMREDECNFYFIIDDCLLFNEYPEYNRFNGYYSDYFIKHQKREYLRKNKSIFYKNYNRIINRKYRYFNIKILGIISEDDDFYIFHPYEIVSNNNYQGVDKLYGKEMPFSKKINNSIGMIYLENAKNGYYSDEELKEKIEEYHFLLNHIYQIKKSNLAFYVDFIESDKNGIIYEQLLNSAFGINYRNRYVTKSFLDNKKNTKDVARNSIIITNRNINRVMKEFPNYSVRYMYDSYKMHGVNFREPLDFNKQLDYVICDLIASSHNNSFDDLGLIIYTENDFSLCQSPNKELFNIYRKYTFKKMYDIIKEIRKKGKQEMFINNELKNVDLSNIKLIIICSKGNISTIDYISDILDDCSIIDWSDKTKVLKRGDKSEY